MIESRLDASMDGLSHLAKGEEYTVSKIAELFRLLAAEGQARSVASVLRIVAEQSHGRRIYPNGPIPQLIAMLTFTVVEAALIPNDSPYRERVEGLLIVMGLIDIALALSIRSRQRRKRRYQSQIFEIQRLAIECLGVVVGRPDFVPKALTTQARRTFDDLRKRDPLGWAQIANALEGQ